MRVPVEVYWSVAFAPLYQLVKFHLHGRGLPGTPRFALDEKFMDQTLDLVVKALTPPRRRADRAPAQTDPLAARSSKHPNKKAIS